MAGYKVTIGIPVYNIEKYIRQGISISTDIHGY